MPGYGLAFLIIALIAGILGFGFIAGTVALIIQICFILLLVLILAALLVGKHA